MGDAILTPIESGIGVGIPSALKALILSVYSPSGRNSYSLKLVLPRSTHSMFSSSSLRYVDGGKEISGGKIGKVIGVNAYSPAPIEEHHPDLFWYGVHGVEILFAVMGTGCKSVQRTFTENSDVVTGIWEDGRIGCFRGIREGKRGYGGTVFGEDGISQVDEYQGYNPLLEKIAEFFDTGVVPVSAEETLEIFAFMQAADESKLKRGATIEIEAVMQHATANK